MRILVVGSLGAEHALLQRLSQSPLVEKLYSTDFRYSKISEIAVPCEVFLCDKPEYQDWVINELLTIVEKEQIDLTIVGREVLLSADIVGAFERRG